MREPLARRCPVGERSSARGAAPILPPSSIRSESGGIRRRVPGFGTLLVALACAMTPAAEAGEKRSGGAAPREPLSLTYVANEGVLLASGGTKV